MSFASDLASNLASNFVPNPVTHTSSRLLEFETLRDLLSGYASSPLGQRRIAELVPSLDNAWIETQQQLTTEIREYRRVGGRFEFAGLPEVRKADREVPHRRGCA